MTLTLDSDDEFAAGSVVGLVVGDIADNVLPLWKLRPRFWAPQCHSGPKRQRVASGCGACLPSRGFGLILTQRLQGNKATRPHLGQGTCSTLHSPFDNAISRILHVGWVPVHGGCQFLRLCHPLACLWTSHLGGLNICPSKAEINCSGTTQGHGTGRGRFRARHWEETLKPIGARN